MTRLLWVLVLIGGLLGAEAWAHKPSDSFLRLAVDEEQIEGRWDIRLQDLNYALTLDADGDGRVTWGEVRSRSDDIRAWALARLAVKSGKQACDLEAGELRMADLSDGPYVALPLHGSCPEPPEEIEVSYRLLFDLDPSHRGMIFVEFGSEHSGVFSPSRNHLTFSHGRPDAGRAFAQYFQEGVWHIALGLDHLLFLTCLLLPAVVHRRGRAWVAATSGRRALVDVVKIITAFTVAHAVSLTLASLGWLLLPTRPVEAAVAATILFAAINNIAPMVRGERLWVMAFFFGLIHGAGYASLLADAGLSAGGLALALAGFNLGVESVQVAVAACFIPIAYWMRHRTLYQWGAIGGGSLLVAGVSLLWLVERLFNIQLGVGL